MKQFGKNLLAMLLTAFSLCCGGAIVSFVFSLLSALSLWWLIVVSLLSGSIIIGFGPGLMISAMSYLIKLLNHSKSGMVMCTLSCLYSIVYNIISAIEMVNDYNAINQIGQTKFLILQIISSVIIVGSIIYCIIIIWMEPDEIIDRTSKVSKNTTSKVSTNPDFTVPNKIAKVEPKTEVLLKHLNPLLTITDHSWSNISLIEDEESVISKTINLRLWTKEEKDNYFKENRNIQNISREMSNSVCWTINCENKLGCDIEFGFQYSYKEDFFYLSTMSFVYHSSNLKDERTRIINVLSKRFEILGSIEDNPCVFAPPLCTIYVSIYEKDVRVVVFVPIDMMRLI